MISPFTFPAWRPAAERWR